MRGTALKDDPKAGFEPTDSESALPASARRFMSEFVFPAVAIAMGVAALVAKSGVDERAERLGSQEPLGPGTFLAGLAGLLIGTGLVLMMQVWSDLRRADDFPPADLTGGGEPIMTARQQMLLIGCLLGLLGAFAILLQYGGFVVGMLLVLFLGSWTIKRSWRSAVVGSVIGTATLYLIFVIALEVPLPLGPLV